MKALVLGGAACLWDDLEQLSQQLGPWDGLVIATNDAGTVFSGRLDVWATLHAEKLEDWKAARAAQGLSMDFATWGRPEKPGVDRTLAGWTSGSSGLFAVGVALELGSDLVVLAGVPLDPRPHFFDRDPWAEAALASYRRTWERRADRLRGRVFSLSGWTRDLLGPPPQLAGPADFGADVVGLGASRP